MQEAGKMPGVFISYDQLREMQYMRFGQKIIYFDFVAEKTNRGIVISEKKDN